MSDERNKSVKSGQPERREGGFGGRGGGGPGGMSMTAEKAKNFKGSFKRLMNTLRPQLPAIAAVMLLSVISTVFSIFTPKVLARATDALFRGIAAGSVDIGYIGNVLLTVGGLYALSALFSFLSHFIAASLSQNIVYRMRFDVKQKLDRLPLAYFDKHSHGDILSRVTNDIDTISSTLQQSITQIISGVFTIIGVVVMMLSISWLMTLVTVLTLPFIALVTTIIAKKSQKLFAAQQAGLGRLTGHVEEAYSGHRVVKLFGREDRMIEGFEAINSELVSAGFKAQFLSGIIMPSVNLINNLGYVAVCVAGGLLAGSGRLTVGGIQAFIQYANQFQHPLSQTANIANIIQSAVAAAERVFEILDETEEIADPEIPLSVSGISGSVEFSDVDFSYTPDTELIRGMNISVRSGDSIAIVGPTGAGKTTLVNLLMRFYELDGGRILIDGKDAAGMARKDLRSLYGMVLQDTWLFSGSIRDNIAYARPDASMEEVEEAARKAHIAHFIHTLPDGYDTLLGENAGNISQGQKQLLTIARAILADPKILILDEATSSVDTRTEAYIQNAMTAMMKGKTSFVIAHRLSTIKSAALILVMDKGSVVEQGTHQELLDKGGFYAELYNSQFNAAASA